MSRESSPAQDPKPSWNVTHGWWWWESNTMTDAAAGTWYYIVHNVEQQSNNSRQLLTHYISWRIILLFLFRSCPNPFFGFRPLLILLRPSYTSWLRSVVAYWNINTNSRLFSPALLNTVRTRLVFFLSREWFGTSFLVDACRAACACACACASARLACA